jgi:cytochrome c biogenesis protein
MTTPTLSTAPPDPDSESDRGPGELGPVELARWSWRTLTSMRTALVLLLLLALAAVPGSVIPQEDVDSLKTAQWQEAHPKLTPVYARLGLFSVYDSVWFSAIYLLLVVSLVGCILPRSLVYWRALRARPPASLRHLDRLPGYASYITDQEPAAVLGSARELLRARRFRLRDVYQGESGQGESGGAVSGERGYLREAGNLLFHLAVLVVLAGFAIGSLFGYRGGTIVLVGGGFANNLTQYDDFAPGSLFDAGVMEPFSFDIERFDIEWIESGRGRGQARKFVSALTYRETPSSPERSYDLKVNHPLSIGGTDVFLIGHGYAADVTVRDGEGTVVQDGPVVFLPSDATFVSFGVVKAQGARPAELGFEGIFYPAYINLDGESPATFTGDDRNPLLSLIPYSGDLGLADGTSQSVYQLDKRRMDVLRGADGERMRLALEPGETAKLPDGLGSVTFNGVTEWNRLQISRTPGMAVTLAGALLALLGLLGSLYVRPRRIWVRARREGSGTLVEVGGLDRVEGGDVGAAVTDMVARLRTAGLQSKEQS